MIIRIKQFVKWVLPEKLFVIRTLLLAYWYDFSRYFKYSNSYKSLETLQKHEALLTYYYHVIEKGLTMPEPRIGFGLENMNKLLDSCFDYLRKGFDTERLTFGHCLSVMEEYLDFHHAAGYVVDLDLETRIKKLINNRGFNRCNQRRVLTNDFFHYKDSDFTSFCFSRHTVRNYVDKVISDQVFYDCVELAQKSPSACNRQPNGVYIIRDKKTKEMVLSLQNGNRGFGHLASAIVIFTGDISSFRFESERNELFFNSGLFAMTFMYALHHKGIGACALNWSVPPKTDKKLRKIINVRESETVTMLLSCGYLPNELKVATSPRRDTKEAISFL